ncbi:MAG TPA: GNAT family N-acetyltransferase [Candidatus Limnocylindrales bacterium]|nr:GNAT family N-acetyltransferase [Candidatus Limnocylindrales bacterium]
MGAIEPALEGLVLRPYAGEGDVAHTVRVANAEMAADGIREHVTVEERLAHYRHANELFDPRRDVTLAEVDGVVVAYGVREWVDTTDGVHREYRIDGSADPEWRRRGIGAALLAENIQQARRLAASHDTGRRKVLGSWSGATQTGDIALLERSGFRQVRWFFEMTRPTLDDIPEVPMPDGIEVREVKAADTKAVWDADVEAFQDHWGGFDGSEQSMRRFMDSPEFDPSLWVIAFDGEQIAGGVINGIYPEENEALGLRRGWLDSVFTRRAWRRRGLARALIARSLLKLRQRGMSSAVLGVDADNPTGALGLYESVGFRVSHRAIAWRRQLDDRG